jgi:predicted metalloprotease with PDZ domain
MKAALSFSLLVACAAAPLSSQIIYDVSFPNAVHHEAEISVTFPDLPNRPLELRMSRSSPGRYAIHEFGKNVYSIRAEDGRGETLEISRPNPYQWDVMGHDGTVKVTYTLFADRAGGTYAGIDETHAHLNMPAAFMWARGLHDRPIRITFRPPADSGWKVASQLGPTDDPMTFTAPHLQYFLDSPTELSDHTMRTWEVTSNGRSYTMRMAVHHEGTEAEVDEYVEMAKKVVDEQIAVFGEPPAFEFDTYTFIADYLPYVSGDGMEHRNSTILASTRSLREAARGLLGTVSHEFFHAWNVERIRPRSLEPFDFEGANMSGELWFAEGFTSYYTGIFLKRAGLRPLEEYAHGLSGGLDFVITSPARRFFSAVEMSMQAPFVDAARSVDPTNLTNTFISYYTWGSVIGLNLDLTLRSQFDQTLDDFMRLVWQKYGKTEIPYTVNDLQQTLGEFTGDGTFAAEFFGKFITGREVPDYERLLANAGFLLRKANPGVPYLGVVLDEDSSGVFIQSGTSIGRPAYNAGLDRGDRFISLDGKRVTNLDELRAAYRPYQPGDDIEVVYEQRGRTKTATLHLIENPHLEVVTYEEAGMPVTEDMRRFRDSWLGAKVRREK